MARSCGVAASAGEKQSGIGFSHREFKASSSQRFGRTSPPATRRSAAGADHPRAAAVHRGATPPFDRVPKPR